MTVVTRTIPSPVGDILLVGDGHSLQGVYTNAHVRPPVIVDGVEDEGAFDAAARQMDEWFAGDRQVFELSMSPKGTDFQRRVWDVLVEIPFGETATYCWVATKAGCPGSARAVGHAVGRNPVGIVVPCHRVVGANGSLTGYAGGLDTKRWLLDHERAISLAASSA